MPLKHLFPGSRWIRSVGRCILLVPILAILAQILCGRLLAQSTSANTLPDGPDPVLVDRHTQANEPDLPAIVNGRPYVRPSRKDQFKDYLRDTYGLPALARTAVRASYGQGMGLPSGWGQDWSGFGQRFGSSSVVTVIDGNMRYSMETIFREDMRYIPCHGCSVKRKIENALMAEISARHDSDGHRFFTLTPVISDMTGPIVANSFWVPDHGPVDGVIGSRVTVATRIGAHLFNEFVLELRHHDPKLPD
jgi:hypothetical protein